MARGPNETAMRHLGCRRRRRLDDLVRRTTPWQLGKVMALDKLGQGGHALRIARGWLRPKLSGWFP